MVGSLQIAAPTTPNPTNSLANVSTTDGSVSGIDSAAIAVTITAEAAEHRTTTRCDFDCCIAVKTIMFAPSMVSIE
eukprot:scaffold4911_cov47-Cyclotella_meneghiniana.AAC.15